MKVYYIFSIVIWLQKTDLGPENVKVNDPWEEESEFMFCFSSIYICILTNVFGVKTQKANRCSSEKYDFD